MCVVVHLQKSYSCPLRTNTLMAVASQQLSSEKAVKQGYYTVAKIPPHGNHDIVGKSFTLPDLHCSLITAPETRLCLFCSCSREKTSQSPRKFDRGPSTRPSREFPCPSVCFSLSPTSRVCCATAPSLSAPLARSRSEGL